MLQARSIHHPLLLAGWHGQVIRPAGAAAHPGLLDAGKALVGELRENLLDVVRIRPARVGSSNSRAVAGPGAPSPGSPESYAAAAQAPRARVKCTHHCPGVGLAQTTTECRSGSWGRGAANGRAPENAGRAPQRRIVAACIVVCGRSCAGCGMKASGCAAGWPLDNVCTKKRELPDGQQPRLSLEEGGWAGRGAPFGDRWQPRPQVDEECGTMEPTVQPCPCRVGSPGQPLDGNEPSSPP